MVQMCLDSFRIRYIRTFLYRCDPKIRPENPRKLRESSAKDPWEPRPAGMAPPRNSIRERLISGSIEQVLFVPATTNHRPTGHRPPATGHQMQCPSRCCRNDNSCKTKSIEKHVETIVSVSVWFCLHPACASSGCVDWGSVWSSQKEARRWWHVDPMLNAFTKTYQYLYL